MKHINDIRQLFIEEYKSGRYKETGYDCSEGNEYIELRNVVFEVDQKYIFKPDNINIRMNEYWYIKNYEPRINFQIDNLINRLIENPLTRQAILILAHQYELESPGFICTIYIHIFLDKINNNEYDIEYSVHMRSNNVIDFITDIQWNDKIFEIIIKQLKNKTGWKLNKKNIIWCVDSLHIYKKDWNLLYEKN